MATCQMGGSVNFSVKSWLVSVVSFARHTVSLKLYNSVVGWADISSVQSLSRVRLFVTPWMAARQASLSITNSRSSLRLKSIESVMPSSHLILCRPLLLLPPIPPSIRVFSSESTLCMKWPKYWSFSFSIIPSKGQKQFNLTSSLTTKEILRTFFSWIQETLTSQLKFSYC